MTIRSRFERELTTMRDDVLRLASMVDRQLEDAMISLKERDLVKAQAVIDKDHELNDLRYHIEEECLALIALQQPAAIDLRNIIAVMNIILDLERMGDLALNIAKAARKTTVKSEGSPELIALINKMGKKVHKVVDASLDAFDRKDCSLAQKLPEMDEPIDALFKQFFKELTKSTDEESLEWASNMVLASRYLERIADHAVDIGERVCYLVTGEFQEFSDQEQ